ncbi:nitric oxide reductase activation protein NorD [Sulfuriflexus mobilis]|uniref:nitric oxide reductase activation protein NorD n=1 Tax=Sulfuriflexus mobilis TaxID=1811807 RepID=UPI001E28E9B4|nr:VWA domain-containing protein [Sulfuriflexus mobilis]
MALRAPRALQVIHRLVELEEHVGTLWHRLVTQTATQRYPDAAVYLEDVRRSVGVLFRAMGGDGGLKIASTPATEYGAQRTWLQRIAGTNKHVELAWRNESSLNLPACIDVFAKQELNHDLYLWLAALASADGGIRQEQNDWINYNQWLSCKVLKRFPGLINRYQRLVEAQLALRPDVRNLTTDAAKLELAIQHALEHPGQARALPDLSKPPRYLPQPVFLWLHPSPPLSATASTLPQDDEAMPEANGEVIDPQEQRRYRAEKVDMPDGKNGLVLDRFENIFSWAEYIKVDRSTDEDEDLESAEDTAKDLEQLSVARDSKTTAKRIRFDLDLPSAESDDSPLGEGILLPEWDYRKGELIKDYCCLQPMIADTAEAIELPTALRSTAKRLRSQFEALVPSRIWYRGQQEGSEIDLDAYLDFITEQKQTRAIAEQGMYREFRGGIRDLACLLLADLSLSTDSWVNNHARVIDVVRDSLLLFAEALSATGDQFAMYGFSSRYRQHIRFHTLKTFNEAHNNISRGRINAIRPGFYTRMGAAIRQASEILSKQPASQQLLLLLTDGKPNDLDQYDGRYGIEDTRMALIEARRRGLQPFCVTIDEKAGDYLPYMFGADNYVVIRKPSELPRELPLLYARLTH